MQSTLQRPPPGTLSSVTKPTEAQLVADAKRLSRENAELRERILELEEAKRR
jgi:hypothetical protein